MNKRVKITLDAAVFIYRNAPDKDLPEMRDAVNRNLKKHYDGLRTIGIGLDPDYVTAALIFKRIFKI